MKQRRETREKIARWQASQAELTRAVQQSTMTAAEFADFTGLKPAQVSEEMDAGTISWKTVGKQRRIQLTPEVRERLLAGLAAHKRVLDGMEEQLKVL